VWDNFFRLTYQYYVMQGNIKGKVQANRMIFVLLKWRPFVKKNARNKFTKALLATRYPLFMYKRGLTVLLHHHRLVVWKGLYQIRKWVLCVFWQTSVFKISIIYFLLAASQIFLWFFFPKNICVKYRIIKLLRNDSLSSRHFSANRKGFNFMGSS
jgi:hypothetical protein